MLCQREVVRWHLIDKFNEMNKRDLHPFKTWSVCGLRSRVYPVERSLYAWRHRRQLMHSWINTLGLLNGVSSLHLDQFFRLFVMSCHSSASMPIGNWDEVEKRSREVLWEMGVAVRQCVIWWAWIVGRLVPHLCISTKPSVFYEFFDYWIGRGKILQLVSFSFMVAEKKVVLTICW